MYIKKAYLPHRLEHDETTQREINKKNVIARYIDNKCSAKEIKVN